MVRNKKQSADDDDQGDDVVAFLCSDKFQKIVDDIVSTRLAELTERVNSLQNEVKSLRESNIDLIKLLSSNVGGGGVKNNRNNKIVNVNVDNASSKQSYSGKLSDDGIKNSIKPGVDSANRKNANRITASDGKKTTADRHTVNDKSERKESKIIVGSSERSMKGQASGFIAAERKLHVYVGRCSSTTKCEDISAWLKSTWADSDFEVTRLDSKGSNASFRVAVDTKLADSIYEADLWPKGIIVKKFRFFRPKSFK